jgi:hypothetical protein
MRWREQYIIYFPANITEGGAKPSFARICSTAASTASAMIAADKKHCHGHRRADFLCGAGPLVLRGALRAAMVLVPASGIFETMKDLPKLVTLNTSRRALSCEYSFLQVGTYVHRGTLEITPDISRLLDARGGARRACLWLAGSRASVWKHAAVHDEPAPPHTRLRSG